MCVRVQVKIDGYVELLWRQGGDALPKKVGFCSFCMYIECHVVFCQAQLRHWANRGIIDPKTVEEAIQRFNHEMETWGK